MSEHEELAALINQVALAWEPDVCLLGNMTASQLARAAALLPQGRKVERWPETYSRRQRAEKAARLCTEAGIDLKSPDAQRLVRDARDGMPLHDVLDLIKHWNAAIATEPPTDD